MIRCDRVIVERGGRMVVDRVTLGVGPGETLAVIGRSGAGKTSLLAAIAGGLPLHGGDIAVAGHSLRGDGDAARAVIGYVPPLPPSRPGVRADDFLALFATAAGLHGRVLAAAVERGLDAAGLRGRGDARLDQLGDGQARRLLFARAMLHAPAVLVLDDPFAGLDPTDRSAVERLVTDMHIGGGTVIAAIGDALVPECFTHLAVMDQGRIVRHERFVFAAFAPGREWRFRVRCPAAAEAAARAVAGPTGSSAAGGRACEVIDADTVDVLLPGEGHAAAAVVQALVRGGIAVESFALHPAWPAQLLATPAA